MNLQQAPSRKDVTPIMKTAHCVNLNGRFTRFRGHCGLEILTKRNISPWKSLVSPPFFTAVSVAKFARRTRYSRCSCGCGTSNTGCRSACSCAAPAAANWPTCTTASGRSARSAVYLARPARPRGPCTPGSPGASGRSAGAPAVSSGSSGLPRRHRRGPCAARGRAAASGRRSPHARQRRWRLDAALNPPAAPVGASRRPFWVTIRGFCYAWDAWL
jgi:hypothetical protein